VPDHPEVFVIGDACAAAMTVTAGTAAPAATGQQWVPGLAAAANQMGEHTARTIERTISRDARQPFRYRNRGSLAVIGRGRAVAEFERRKVTGRVAWWVWLTIHIAYLAGFRNRVSVLLEWAYAYFTFRPGARLITDDRPPASAVTAPVTTPNTAHGR
jgi:NADH dehydrogenase